MDKILNYSKSDIENNSRPLLQRYFFENCGDVDYNSTSPNYLSKDKMLFYSEDIKDEYGEVEYRKLTFPMDFTDLQINTNELLFSLSKRVQSNPSINEIFGESSNKNDKTYITYSHDLTYGFNGEIFDIVISMEKFLEITGIMISVYFIDNNYDQYVNKLSNKYIYKKINMDYVSCCIRSTNVIEIYCDHHFGANVDNGYMIEINHHIKERINSCVYDISKHICFDDDIYKIYTDGSSIECDEIFVVKDEYELIQISTTYNKIETYLSENYKMVTIDNISYIPENLINTFKTDDDFKSLGIYSIDNIIYIPSNIDCEILIYKNEYMEAIPECDTTVRYLEKLLGMETGELTDNYNDITDITVKYPDIYKTILEASKYDLCVEKLVDVKDGATNSGIYNCKELDLSHGMVLFMNNGKALIPIMKDDNKYIEYDQKYPLYFIYSNTMKKDYGMNIVCEDKDNIIDIYAKTSDLPKIVNSLSLYTIYKNKQYPLRGRFKIDDNKITVTINKTLYNDMNNEYFTYDNNIFDYGEEPYVKLKYVINNTYTKLDNGNYVANRAGNYINANSDYYEFERHQSSKANTYVIIKNGTAYIISESFITNLENNTYNVNGNGSVEITKDNDNITTANITKGDIENIDQNYDYYNVYIDILDSRNFKLVGSLYESYLEILDTYVECDGELSYDVKDNMVDINFAFSLLYIFSKLPKNDNTNEIDISCLDDDKLKYYYENYSTVIQNYLSKYYIKISSDNIKDYSYKDYISDAITMNSTDYVIYRGKYYIIGRDIIISDDYCVTDSFYVNLSDVYYNETSGQISYYIGGDSKYINLTAIDDITITKDDKISIVDGKICIKRKDSTELSLDIPLMNVESTIYTHDRMKLVDLESDKYNSEYVIDLDSTYVKLIIKETDNINDYTDNYSDNSKKIDDVYPKLSNKRSALNLFDITDDIKSSDDIYSNEYGKSINSEYSIRDSYDNLLVFTDGYYNKDYIINDTVYNKLFKNNGVLSFTFPLFKKVNNRVDGEIYYEILKEYDTKKINDNIDYPVDYVGSWIYRKTTIEPTKENNIYKKLNRNIYITSGSNIRLYRNIDSISYRQGVFTVNSLTKDYIFNDIKIKGNIYDFPLSTKYMLFFINDRFVEPDKIKILSNKRFWVNPDILSDIIYSFDIFICNDIEPLYDYVDILYNINTYRHIGDNDEYINNNGVYETYYYYEITDNFWNLCGEYITNKLPETIINDITFIDRGRLDDMKPIEKVSYDEFYESIMTNYDLDRIYSEYISNETIGYLNKAADKKYPDEIDNESKEIITDNGSLRDEFVNNQIQLLRKDNDELISEIDDFIKDLFDIYTGRVRYEYDIGSVERLPY